MNNPIAYPVEFLSNAPAAMTGCFCIACCEMFYPQLPVCPRCGGKEMAEQGFSGKGDVYSYTIVREAPAGFVADAPYVVVLVHLSEGAYVTARLLDLAPASIYVGMPLEMVPGSEGRLFRLRQSLVD
jgi:uncharacterized protein